MANRWDILGLFVAVKVCTSQMAFLVAELQEKEALYRSIHYTFEFVTALCVVRGAEASIS
ncbi:MAG: hypothetical protein JWN98_1621 [Abditibacteriota bacterium]|nr:hypothetical protein [Abditibacteriota bacterium]